MKEAGKSPPVEHAFAFGLLGLYYSWLLLCAPSVEVADKDATVLLRSRSPVPTSHYQKISALVELIVLSDPKRVLDIGVGFGKYGVLAREYLELWDTTAPYGRWQRRIDGIEIYREYLSPLHDYIYDTIYVGSAVDVLGTLKEPYDLVLLIDILEHLTHDEGRRLMERCHELARNILVCTPKDIGEQGQMFGNPSEAHISQWERKDFEIFENHFFVPNSTSHICFIGKDAKRVWRWRLNSRLARSRRYDVET